MSSSSQSGQRSSSISQNKTVEEHEGGQLVLPCVAVSFLIPGTVLQAIVPSTAKWRDIFFDYFLDPLGGIPPVVDENSETSINIPGNKM